LENYLAELWKLKERESTYFQNMLLEDTAKVKSTKKKNRPQNHTTINDKEKNIQSPNIKTSVKESAVDKMEDIKTDTTSSDPAKMKTFKPVLKPNSTQPKTTPTSTASVSTSLPKLYNANPKAMPMIETNVVADNNTAKNTCDKINSPSLQESSSETISAWIAKVKGIPVTFDNPTVTISTPKITAVELDSPDHVSPSSAIRSDQFISNGAAKHIYEIYPLCYELDIKPENICGML
jgi:hypothetical protein